jgi:hypothetical protein
MATKPLSSEEVTMRIVDAVQATVQVQQVKFSNGQAQLQAMVQLQLPWASEAPQTPQHAERVVDVAGQKIKRQLFRALLVQADAELILQQRAGRDGQGIQQRGTTPLTFKTVFGTVVVPRRRIVHKADQRSEVPAAHAWQTPQQVCITPGLRHAVQTALADESTRAALASVEAAAAEPGLLCPATVLNVLHAAGAALHTAAQQRADDVYASDADGQQLFARLAQTSPPPAPEAFPDDAAALEGAEAEPLPPDARAGLVGFADTPAEGPVPLDLPRQADPGTIVAQFDEVKTKAQACTGQKEVWLYTAVLLLGGVSVYFSAPSCQALWYQVGAWLTVQGVHQQRYRLLVVGDGARWIRQWFEALVAWLPSAAMVLCWFHLKQRCQQNLSLACRGREHRAAVLAEILPALWEGKVTEALAALQRHRDEMKNGAALDDLIGYLEQRRAYLPNYQQRQAAGLWIASTRVEKFNDWSVSARCKQQGMAWTADGVGALAALETARRNGEWDSWQATSRLPAWQGIYDLEEERSPTTLAA